MEYWISVIFAMMAGLFTTLESSINADLGEIVTPKIATLHSLITGTVIILAFNLLRGTLHQYSKIIYVRPQLLIGGFFGAMIIYLVTQTIPKLGVASTLTIVVATQIVSGVIVDMMATKQTEPEIGKLFGIFLLLMGTYFINK